MHFIIVILTNGQLKNLNDSIDTIVEVGFSLVKPLFLHNDWYTSNSGFRIANFNFLHHNRQSPACGGPIKFA
jgi:hypothetical protein